MKVLCNDTMFVKPYPKMKSLNSMPVIITKIVTIFKWCFISPRERTTALAEDLHKLASELPHYGKSSVLAHFSCLYSYS